MSIKEHVRRAHHDLEIAHLYLDQCAFAGDLKRADALEVLKAVHKAQQHLVDALIRRPPPHIRVIRRLRGTTPMYPS